MTVFYERFTGLCNSNGIAPNAVAKELKIPSGSITAWSGTTIPRLSTVKKIADRFGVSVSYLTGDTDEQTPPTLNEKGGARQRLLEETRDMNAEELQAVAQYIAFLKSQRP